MCGGFPGWVLRKFLTLSLLKESTCDELLQKGRRCTHGLEDTWRAVVKEVINCWFS
jgi:hypothetical protein